MNEERVPATLVTCIICGTEKYKYGECANCGRIQAQLKLQASPSGAKSSLSPRFDLLPRRALERVAARYEKGLERYGKDNWRKGLTDRKYIVERIAHIIGHCYKLIDKLENRENFSWPHSDDDASAIGWGGLFVCEAMYEIEKADEIAHGLRLKEEAQSDLRQTNRTM